MCLLFPGKIQDVILQEHIEKEDEVLVSLAGLKQVCECVSQEFRFYRKRTSETRVTTGERT